jgi:hypothetical protein
MHAVRNSKRLNHGGLRMKTIGILMIGAILAAVTSNAQAAMRLNATRPGNFLSSSSFVALPLNNVGATTLTFNLASNRKLLLTFSAECSVGSTIDFSTVDLDVVVNNAVVAPTASTGDTFCSANDTPTASDGWTRASITVQIQGIAGNNTVKIFGRLNSGGDLMYFGDSALVVFDP